VYTCHFCHHENLKRGTPKGTVKNLVASRPRKSNDTTPKIVTRHTLEEAAANSPKTPTPKISATRDYNISNDKMNDFSPLSAYNEVGSSSKKRQRKGWLSLKDKAKADTSVSFASPFKM
jgi:hypothetical protein